ncbi:MAG: PHP domain-containing protein [Acidimicrobiales bacterium]
MIDLHTHSTCSDGSASPKLVCELAAQAGCSAVSLTDHDTLEGIPAATAAAARLGITLVPGCEVSFRLPSSRSAHALVYFPASGTPLDAELFRLRKGRVARNREMVALLASLGMDIAYDELVGEAAGEESAGRPHMASVMVHKGYVGSIEEAFGKWLGAGRPAYVPRESLEAARLAELSKLSGSVVVLAHPLRTGLPASDLGSLVEHLAGVGFDGIEAYYSSYLPEERAWLAGLADANSLIATGGSDFHGTYKPGIMVGIGMGDLDVPDSVLEQLVMRCRSYAG